MLDDSYSCCDHCLRCDRGRVWHSVPCVECGQGCDVHGNDCAADCVHRGVPKSGGSE